MIFEIPDVVTPELCQELLTENAWGTALNIIQSGLRQCWCRTTLPL